MKTSTGRPEMADPRNMTVVHSAMRRDLVRIQLLLDSPTATEPATRRRLAEHLRWFADFLDHHHAAEDAWLWPVLRERGQAAVADETEAEHVWLASAMADLRSAVEAYATNRDTPASLASAVAALASFLADHLLHEEGRVLPLAGELITRREWVAFEKEGALKGRSTRELGWDANWIMDGTSEEQRDVFLRGVPRPVRLLVFDRFAPAYRRDRDALWGGTPAADVPPHTAADFAGRGA